MEYFSQQIKQSKHGDEYYSPQNVVDMIVPYVMSGGGIKRFGARLIQKTATL